MLGGILGVLAAIAGLLLHSWLPLMAVGVVLLCVMGLTMSESALFAPLLNLVLHAGERAKKRKTVADKPSTGAPPLSHDHPAQDTDGTGLP
ncbi:MAG: hypothetical protein ACOYOU_14085 [Kiritimatiellia bacterium]